MDEANQNQSEEKIVAEFAKNDRETVKLRLSVFRGKEYVDLRLYIKGADGEEIPTKKGVNLPIEKIPELKKAIAKLK